MKTTFSIAAKLFILLLATSALQCSDLCTTTETYYYSKPVYMSLGELRSSVKSEAPTDLVHAGKIYFKDDFLYVNEVGKGIHVIDNHDPSNPVHRSFIKIPGSVDLAILGNTLYADSYVDLVAIDVSTPGQEREVARYKDMFSRYSAMNLGVDPEKGVIVDFGVVEETTIRNGCFKNWEADGWRTYDAGILMTAQAYSSTKNSNAPSNMQPGSTEGIGGSMARFTIKFDHLYALDANMLDVVDISNASEITLKTSVPVSSDIETIFPYNDNLFLGSRSGMYIFGISEPANPKHISTFSHMKSCDPVVVQGDFAYVTLRNGNTCNGTINELQVIDIRNLSAPQLLRTYPMTNPHGLGIDNDVLFICDGTDGLKVYDASDINNISSRLKAHYTDLQAFDIIPFNNVAMMIGEDGLYQYDYSDLQNIHLLSKIEIKGED